MTTFNVDSLDFADDETVQQGAAPDFEWGFDSANSRFELTDLVNSTTAHIQQNRAGDLVDGRFAEAVDEGKILTDNGEVYDSTEIGTAMNEASSWMKLGPGSFPSINVLNSGMTVLGSGEQTKVYGDGANVCVYLNEQNLTLADMTIFGRGNDAIRTSSDVAGGSVHLENLTVTTNSGVGINPTFGNAITITDCRIYDIPSHGVDTTVSNVIVSNCQITNCGDDGIFFRDDDSIVVNNQVEGIGAHGIVPEGNDNIIIGNRVSDAVQNGILVTGTDNIVANNRISGTTGINDSGTGTVLDANLTGASN